MKVTYTQQAKVTEGGQQGRAYEEQGKGEYSYRKTRNEREIKESASYLRVRWFVKLGEKLLVGEAIDSARWVVHL